MNIWEAFLLAAAFTLVCAGYVGKKVIKIDLSGLLPKNWKRAKRRRLLAERRTPLQGAGLRDDIKKSFENVLLPLGRADKGLLPARMDKTFRRNTERQLELLKQRKLCREIRLADVVPVPKNDFKRWNDDGREWRESILQCCALERFASSGGEKLIQETYHKKAYARILQSRHVRNADRVGKKENYYADRIKILFGVELGLQPQLMRQDAVYAKSYDFDFIIGSSHLCRGRDPYYPSFYEGRTEEQAYMEYFESVLENIKKHSNFDVYGHLDYVVRYGPNKDRNYSYVKYRDILDEILKALLDREKGIEVNTGGLKEGLRELHPCKDILKRYRELGGEIVTVGSDSHDTGHIAAHFHRAAEILLECGFRYYTVFEKRIPEFCRI